MLTCYGHSVRLPQNDLAYLAFRLAVEDGLTDIELQVSLAEEPDPPVGYLTEVPFLEQVPLPVQIDLLSETWSRHRTTELTEASLLDAAIVYAVCRTAARIVHDAPEIALAYLQGGPQKVDPRILRRAGPRLEELFESFWDDQDFLMIDEWQDLPPDKADAMKAIMRVPDEVIQPMYDALERWRVSPDVGIRLAGLMTDEEIAHALPLLEGDVWLPRPKVDDHADDGNGYTGIEDRYHDLMVGPCDPDVAEREECELVWKISVNKLKDFDCTFEDWSICLRADALRAVEQGPREPEPPSTAAEIAALVLRATTGGLPDGAKVVRRGEGWVVVDSFYSYLAESDEASWVVDPDDEDMPAAVYPTAEEAVRAWQRAEAVSAARAQRRQEALRRLGKKAG